MSWHEFEQLIAEMYRQRGYSVTETRAGEDGGIDLRLRKNSDGVLVQCKHWRARRVGVGIVRELYGVMAAQGAAAGAVVTAGHFTMQAREFAGGRNVELIDGSGLEKLVKQIAGNRQPALSDSVVTKGCPQCGAAMVRRVARRGANAGKAFLGCSRFPACRGVSSADASR